MKKFTLIAFTATFLVIVTTFILINIIRGNKNISIYKQEKPSCLNCNVIFISFDTLRADNVGLYGYEKKTTPNIDKFAKEGIVFTNTISVAPWTLPATMSWFTGVYPSQHKILNKFTLTSTGEEKISNLKNLSPNLKTLTEVLEENDYKTGGFTGGAGVHHKFGFNQGFDIYVDDQDFAGFNYTMPKALNWIKDNSNRKIFVFLHGYDIHGQYVPEGGYDYRFVDFDYKGSLTGSKQEQKELREEGIRKGKIFLTNNDVKYLTALYDEKISRADQQFENFLNEYQKLGLMNKTIFILTSDHGEELYEHSRIDHGHSLYEELINVPLIIIYPGIIEKKIIHSQVRSIDIMPTIMDLLGIKLNEEVTQQMASTSLIPLIQGKKLSLDAFPETDYRYSIFLRALRTPDNWKLIQNLESKTEEVYKLNKDSQEKNNQIGNKQTELLRQKLNSHINRIIRN